MSDKPIDNLRRVAQQLYALGITDIVFVGGSTIELCPTDPAAGFGQLRVSIVAERMSEIARLVP